MLINIKAFVSKTLPYENASYAMALTHNICTNITCALLHRTRDHRDLEIIRRMIFDRKDLARAPAYLPVIVAGLEHVVIQQEFISLRKRLLNMERETGHGASFLENGADDFDLINLQEFTKTLNKLASLANSRAARTKTWLLLQEQIARFIVTTQPEDLKLEPSTSQLQDILASLTCTMNMSLPHYTAFAANVQVQIAVVSLISRGNLESVRLSLS